MVDGYVDPWLSDVRRGGGAENRGHLKPSRACQSLYSYRPLDSDVSSLWESRMSASPASRCSVWQLACRLECLKRGVQGARAEVRIRHVKFFVLCTKRA